MIYKIEHEDNVYIGSTTDPKTRQKIHCQVCKKKSDLRLNKGENSKLYQYLRENNITPTIEKIRDISEGQIIHAEEQKEIDLAIMSGKTILNQKLADVVQFAKDVYKYRDEKLR